MKQPVKKNTETKLTEAGRSLFWKFGFTKVTVEEICQSAGVSKMTFYRYFENKTELAKRILDIAAARGAGTVQKYYEHQRSRQKKNAPDDTHENGRYRGYQQGIHRRHLQPGRIAFAGIHDGAYRKDRRPDYGNVPGGSGKRVFPQGFQAGNAPCHEHENDRPAYR